MLDWRGMCMPNFFAIAFHVCIPTINDMVPKAVDLQEGDISRSACAYNDIYVCPLRCQTKLWVSRWKKWGLCLRHLLISEPVGEPLDIWTWSQTFTKQECFWFVNIIRSNLDLLLQLVAQSLYNESGHLLWQCSTTVCLEWHDHLWFPHDQIPTASCVLVNPI
jgi:hypothetical protein